jgi:hypothetical protein
MNEVIFSSFLRLEYAPPLTLQNLGIIGIYQLLSEFCTYASADLRWRQGSSRRN